MFYFIYQIVDEYNNEINQLRNGFNRLIIFGFRNLFYFILFLHLQSSTDIFFIFNYPIEYDVGRIFRAEAGIYFISNTTK